MYLKVYYCGPLLIKFGSHEMSSIHELNLRDLSFRVKVLNEDIDVVMEDFHLGEIVLPNYDWMYLSLQDILERKYKDQFFGKLDLLKELVKSNINNQVFRIVNFNADMEITGSQILDLLALD